MQWLSWICWISAVLFLTCNLPRPSSEAIIWEIHSVLNRRHTIISSKCNPQLSWYGHWWVVYTYLVPVGNRNLWSWSKFWLFDIRNSQDCAQFNLRVFFSICSVWHTKGFLPIFRILGWIKCQFKSLRENCWLETDISKKHQENSIK